MGLMKELNDLNNIYQNMYAEDENKGYVVTRADKKGNTPAWQGYKAGKKKKDGKPMYRAADHLKNEELEVEVDEGYGKIKTPEKLVAKVHVKKGAKLPAGKMKEDYETKKKSEVLSAMKKQGRKLSDKEKNKIADNVVKDKGDTSKSDDRYAYESVGSAVDKTLGAAGEIADTAIKLPAKAVGYLKGLKKGIKKAAKKGETKANEEFESTSEVEKLIESGLFSAREIANIADIQEADIADILARLEKKRISKGGDPEESPLPAMRKYHADKKKKKVKEDYWNEFEEGYQRNPEKGEEEERKRSKRVRGERTPMPPRGDKRREDFERWYAANVR